MSADSLLDVAVQSIDRSLGGDSTGIFNSNKAGSRTWKGTPYVTVTSGGVKGEGDPTPAWFSSCNQAIEKWFEEVVRLHSQSGNDKYICWRSYPEIREWRIPDGFDFSIKSLYSIRSRVAFE